MVLTLANLPRGVRSEGRRESVLGGSSAVSLPHTPSDRTPPESFNSSLVPLSQYRSVRSRLLGRCFTTGVKAVHGRSKQDTRSIFDADIETGFCLSIPRAIETANTFEMLGGPQHLLDECPHRRTGEPAVQSAGPEKQPALVQCQHSPHRFRDQQRLHLQE